MTKLITSDKCAICNRTERFSRMRRQNAPMLERLYIYFIERPRDSVRFTMGPNQTNHVERNHKVQLIIFKKVVNIYGIKASMKP